MEFVVALFTGVFGLIMAGSISGQKYCKGDIVDIYYPADQAHLAYDFDCNYTITQISCANCATLFVSRNNYDKFANRYRELGMKPPVPKRTDTDNVFEPVTYKVIKIAGFKGIKVKL